MQLYALLESLQTYVTGIDQTFVITRASSCEYAQAYHAVNQTFPQVKFLYQTAPYHDLKELTTQCVSSCKASYILFGVDDIMVKDTINLAQCAQALEAHSAHGFFFRLGKNLDYCYPLACSQPVPPLQSVGADMFCWRFHEGIYDWNYPNNLDFTLYRARDVYPLIHSMDYATPNSLESAFMRYAHATGKGLCYAESKIVNFPLNIVQNELPNAHNNSYSTAQLLELFNQGLKIDIKALEKFPNKSAHSSETSCITFIPRENTTEKPIVIVTPSYNNKDWWQWNLESLLHQNYTNYRIIITDDCSPDGTGTLIENYINANQLQQKVTLIKNTERRGALHNLYCMIHSCPDEAIIVTVDGDDALPHPEILNQLNKIYSNPQIWLTYGQYQEYPNGTKGFCSPMPEHIVKNNTFRDHPDLPSHLRTFYAWLFKAIKLEDMLYNGEFYRMTWDCTMMLPMIEMAGERHLCIQDDIMYIYNNANAISDHKVSRQLQAHLAQIIRAKPPYQRLAHSLEKQKINFKNEYADFIIFAEDTAPLLVANYLASLYEKVTGIGHIFVLYRYHEQTNTEYHLLKTKFADATFFDIDPNGECFKDILSVIYHHLLKSNYVIFSMARHIVDAPLDLHECIQALEKTQAYGFSLKLSKINPPTPITERLAVLDIKDDMCAWNYSHANELWSCANSIDLTLYRRDNPTISRILSYCWMYSPVHFQGWWSHEGNLDKVGLCFKYPKIKNV
jgi:glycosyltransferase involved in cell wall biosynthesis